MDDEAFALALARAVRKEVLPLFGAPSARERTGTAHGGDPTYVIDEAGERAVEKGLAERADVAYFTEDEGLIVRGRPRTLFLIDPVDGTRPAAAGYETCCVSIATAPFGEGLSMGDLTYGCLVEIATGAVFEARRGAGARADRGMAPSAARELGGMFWAGGFRGQPAIPTAVVLAGLLDAPGSEGAFFDQGSAAYSLTRVATGQLDAYIDPGRALIERVPGIQKEFRLIGGGHVLNTTTYDVAAGYLLMRELRCPVTDALGDPLEDLPLFDAEGRAETVSTVAAGNGALHALILESVAEGLDRLRAMLDAVGPALLGPRRG